MTKEPLPNTPLVLAEAVVDAVLGQPLLSLCPPDKLVTVLTQAARLHLSSPLAAEQADRLWQWVKGRLSVPGTLRQLVPAPLAGLLRSLVARPYSLPKAQVVALLGRPPLRRLQRELMLATLVDYSRKVRTQVGEVSQSRGGMLGRLATEAVKKSTSAIGSLAPGVTAAVSDELERQFRTRASEFADSAVDDLAQRMAQILTDPTRQAEQRELVLSMLDFALDLPLATIRDELAKMDPVTMAAEVRKGVVAWLSRPDSTADLASLLAQLAPLVQDQSLAALLGPAHGPVRSLLCDILSVQLARHLQPAS